MIPGPGCSGSMITAAPTLWSVMNRAASRSERSGVIVSTFSVIASRTFTLAPLSDCSRFLRLALTTTPPRRLPLPLCCESVVHLDHRLSLATREGRVAADRLHHGRLVRIVPVGRHAGLLVQRVGRQLERARNR